MSWTASITKAPNGELRLQFEQPLRYIDMDRATARQLAALLVVAADGKRSEPLEETGIDANTAEPPGILSIYRSKLAEPVTPLENIATDDVEPKTATNDSGSGEVRPAVRNTPRGKNGCRAAVVRVVQPKTSQTHSGAEASQ
jgi:hypothetical protein